MPTFDTPGPISASIEFGVGNIRIAAGDRHDTNVEVLPTDPAKNEDVEAARQTRVEFAAGRLVVEGPRGRRQWTPWGGRQSIEVAIELPAGSDVRSDAGVASLRATGRLGECSYRTGVGHIHVEEVGALSVKTGAGDVVVQRCGGRVEVTTGAGAVQIGEIDGPAVLKNSSGDTTIDAVTGDLRVNAANGRIHVADAHSSVSAKSAYGDIRLGRIAGGPVRADTAFGQVEIGIRDGVAAWLDLHTSFGTVHSELGAAEQPAEGEQTVEVRARTAFGDVTIRRCPAEVYEHEGA